MKPIDIEVLRSAAAERDKQALAERWRTEEQLLALTEQGYARQRAAAELHFRRELARIASEERERLALYAALRGAGARIDPAEPARIQAEAAAARVLQAQLYDAAMAGIDRREKQDAAARAQEQQKALDDLLAKYRDFEAQRAAVRAQYDADREALTTARGSGAVGAAEADAALKQLEEKRTAALGAVDSAEFTAAKAAAASLGDLFADAAAKSSAQLRKLLADARALYTYLAETPVEQIESKFGIPAPTLQQIKQTPAQMEAVGQAVDKLKKGLADKEVFTAFGNSIKGAFEAFAKGDIAAGLTGVSGAIDAVSPAVKQFGKDLSTITGESKIGENVEIVMNTLGGIGKAAGGVGQMIMGDWAGGVASIASGLGSIFTMGRAADERHQKALKEIAQAKLAFQRSYNLALLKQNLLMEQASNIFGERQIAKAANAVDNYRKAVAQFNSALAGSEAKGKTAEAMAGTLFDRAFGGKFTAAAAAYQQGLGGLYEAKIVTGHKKTGLFGWGKGRDVYGSLLEAYPKLIDKSGKLDTAMLQSILSTRKMKKETRAYLQQLLDLHDAMDAAEQALEGYLTETFGSLGKGMLDALTTAIRGGDTALEGFAARAASVLEKLGEQVVYSLFFADKFDQLQEQLKAIYGSGKSEEAIAADAMALIGAFYDSIGADMTAAETWMEGWRRQAGEKGFDLWSPGGGQSGRAGAFTTMTQDQAAKLEGLFTALQRHGASLDTKMDNVTAGLGGCLDALHRIVQNTDALPLMLALWQAIKRDGLKVR